MTQQDTTTVAAEAKPGDDPHKEELAIYFRVFYALLTLTAVTVGVAYVGGLPDWLAMIIALAIASAKGSLVVLYFMHLKLERRNIYIIAGVPIVLALILLIAVSPDIAGFAGT